MPVWDIDPYDPSVLSAPESYYTELRAKGSFAYIPKYAALACGRYDVTKEVFSDWERFVSSRGVGLQDFRLEKPWRPPSIVLEVDPPYHDKTRRVLNRALSPKAVADLKNAFQEAARRLIDDLLARASFDAIPELAEAFPTSVFPQAVGLRETDRRRLVDYGGMVFNALGPDNEIRRSAMAKAPDIVPWITEHCRREKLEPEGFGATIYKAVDAGEIGEDEAGMLVRSLLSAGVDTTVAALGNAVCCLAANPGEFARLKADPSLARPAFEETLRYTSPVQLSVAPRALTPKSVASRFRQAPRSSACSQRPISTKITGPMRAGSILPDGPSAILRLVSASTIASARTWRVPRAKPCWLRWQPRWTLLS